MNRLIDIVGDVHGHLSALEELGRHLGYDVDRDWQHPDGRALVFLGDLVDRGAESLAVSLLVKRLVERDRAVCLMGNHEYNLVDWLQRGEERTSNRDTIAEIVGRREEWDPVLEFFSTLPLAIELPELRVIHAVWHQECFDRVRPHLEATTEAPHAGLSTAQWVRAHVSLESPYGSAGLHPGLPTDEVAVSNDRPHEVLIKGHEDTAAVSFLDAEGVKRTKVRVTWWSAPDPRVNTDKLVVFGHYWNIPPVAGVHEDLVPPHPSGHPDLNAWQKELAPLVGQRGTFDAPAATRFVCVDYNGVYVAARDDGEARACVGAYRWPENQVAWACAPAS